MTQEYRTLRVTPGEKGVLGVVIDAPPMNLIGPELVRDLVALLGELESGSDVRVVVLESGDPEYFVPHVDLTKVAEYTAEAAKAGGPGDASLGMLWHKLSEVPVVTIAKIRGRARGAGSELALACDMRFAARENTVLGQIEVGVGALPGAGGVQHLARLLGRGRAMEAILGADDFDAETAERYGWINRALPDADLDAFVARLARRIASFPADGVRTAKQVLNDLTMPAADAIRADAVRFRQLVAADPAQARTAALFAQGLQTRGPLELDLGEPIGTLRHLSEGFSIGSFVAQQIALVRPAIVRRLVLASAAPQGAAGMHGWAPEVIGAVGTPNTSPEAYLEVFFARSEASRRAGGEALRRIYARTEDRDQATTWATREAQYDAVCTWGIPDHAKLQQLSCLQMPVLVANGDSDPMILPHYSYLLAGLIPHARVKIYPDAAHGFLFQHHTEFAADVDAFLTNGG